MNDMPLGASSPPPVRQRRAARESEKRRRTRSRRGRVSVIIGLGVLVAAAGLAWFTIRPLINSLFAPDDYPGPGTGQVSVTIPEGATGAAIGRVLREADVVKTADSFVSLADKDARASKIQPGVYTLRKQMSAAGALQVLADPANRVVKKVTVKEGLRLVEILDALAKGSGIPLADFQAAVKQPAEIGLPAEAGGRVEGWLFPATYEISPQTTALDLIADMVQKTKAELTQLGVEPPRWKAVIIEASLVEAERGSDEDAGKIARVFANRIAQKRPLQLDTTVNYALNRRKVAVSLKDLTVDSPFNTYRHAGLPVGAICSPGVVAIQGVLNPVEGPWLYFVAVNPDTGETKYATTEAEFAVLKAELDKWLAANPGR
ncbi:MAG: endolytic transglycosylase MltG [Kineosporiaceae bacterium]|nr:endolytic transglycosylase MltG [Kineosporiaceae bacterium]MBK8076568.1 endolytic transglycosylase MltG [Kineosporiaceae bacterium]